MMWEQQLRVGLTFDDVVLTPRRSNVLPNDVETTTQLTKKYSHQYPNTQCGDGYGH